MNYLLRVTPVQCTKLAAELFDKFLENGLRTIVGGMLDHELFLELQLPANSGPNCKDPTLGLGFTSAVTTAASAFVTSAASSNNLVDAALGDQTPNGLTTYEAAQQAYETWSAQCEQQLVLPFQAFTGERPPNQHKITALVHEKKVQEIAPGSARTRIMRSSMKLSQDVG